MPFGAGLITIFNRVSLKLGYGVTFSKISLALLALEEMNSCNFASLFKDSFRLSLFLSSLGHVPAFNVVANSPTFRTISFQIHIFFSLSFFLCSFSNSVHSLGLVRSFLTPILGSSSYSSQFSTCGNTTPS